MPVEGVVPRLRGVVEEGNLVGLAGNGGDDFLERQIGVFGAGDQFVEVSTYLLCDSACKDGVQVPFWVMQEGACSDHATACRILPQPQLHFRYISAKLS